MVHSKERVWKDNSSKTDRNLSSPHIVHSNSGVHPGSYRNFRVEKQPEQSLQLNVQQRTSLCQHGIVYIAQWLLMYITKQFSLLYIYFILSYRSRYKYLNLNLVDSHYSIDASNYAQGIISYFPLFRLLTFPVSTLTPVTYVQPIAVQIEPIECY